MAGTESAERDFRSLYAENFDAVLAYARRRAPSAGDADDVVAETFLVAWRRWDDLPRRDRRLPYLYGVARRVLANQHRGESRRRRLAERLATEGEPVAPGFPEGGEVEGALESLPEDQREILGLAYWEDLDAGEIAAALGCSRNAARIRLHRARRSLRNALDGGSRDPAPEPITARVEGKRR